MNAAQEVIMAAKKAVPGKRKHHYLRHRPIPRRKALRLPDRKPLFKGPFPFAHVNFLVIHIRAGEAEPFRAHLGKNTLEAVCDMVCWVNHDLQPRTIYFNNGVWPFGGSPPAGGFKVEAASASKWFRLHPKATPGYQYLYQIGEATPPPDGPSVIPDE